MGDEDVVFGRLSAAIDARLSPLDAS
jgi:hypothetical protein